LIQAAFDGKEITEISDRDIQGMPQEQRESLLQQLAEQKLSLRGDASSRFSAFGNISGVEIDHAIAPALESLTLLENRLSLKTTQENLSNRLAFEKTSVGLKLYNDDVTRPYKIFQDNFEGVPLPLNANEALYRSVSTLFGGRLDGGYLGDPTASTEEEKRISGAKAVTFWKSVINGIGETGELDEGQKDTATKLFKGFSKSSVSTYEDMDQKERDRLIEVLQTPQLANLIKNIPESAGDAAKIGFIAEDYTFKVMKAVNADLRSHYKLPAQFRTLGDADTNKVENLITLIPTPNGLKASVNNRTEGARLTASYVTTKYLTRLNKAIRAMSNLDGTSIEATTQSVINARELQGLDIVTSLFENKEEKGEAK